MITIIIIIIDKLSTPTPHVEIIKFRFLSIMILKKKEKKNLHNSYYCLSSDERQADDHIKQHTTVSVRI